MLNASFWSGKRVLVTGHTGFVGSWLALTLQLLGAKVFGFALSPNTEPNLFSILRLEEHLDGHRLGDIRNFHQLKEYFKEASPDIVLHLAAQPLVRYAYYNPLETYQTNVMGTVHLLELFKESDSARSLINVTTDKCYENKEWLWAYRENDSLGGKEPYSNSKACSELVTRAYRESYLKQQNKGVATARAGNIIGGGDWAQDRLIPDFVRALITQKPLEIRHPQAVRPWQYVLDPVFGYLQLAEKLWENPERTSDGWNFGPREEDMQSVEYIIRTLCSTYDLEIHWGSRKDFYESQLLKLDISKAKNLLAWTPTVSLDDALERTMNWYQAFIYREEMFTYTQKEILSQIEVEVEVVL